MEKSKKKRIKAIAGWIIFLPAVAVILFILCVQLFAPQRAVDILGFRLFLIADTKSMEPELKTNDMVAVQKYDFNKLEKGDYITFSAEMTIDGDRQSVVVTHQIVEVLTHETTGARAYRTKGVNPAVGIDKIPVTADGASNTNRFIGKVAFSNRFFGNLLAFFKSPVGITVLIADAVCFILILFLLKTGGKAPKEEPLTAAVAQETAPAGKSGADEPAVSAGRRMKPPRASVRRKGQPEEYIVTDFEVIKGDS